MQVTPKTDRNQQADSLSNTVDSSWLKSTFVIKDSDIVAGNEYSKYIKKNRYYSTADSKYTCTAPGMNIAVNPKPQFTRYCDPRSKGKIVNRPDINVNTRGAPFGLGMGAFYSEAFDDNEQRIYLRFGVPQFMPLLMWIYQSFDVDKVILQNRGAITREFLSGVDLISKIFVVATAPLMSIAMGAIGVFSRNSRFYSVKETMYIYWATVENILNQMVVRRTMVPHVLQDFSFKLDNSINREQKVNSNFVSALNSLIPDIIDRDTGRISVFALALRAQAAFNKMAKEDYEASKTKNLSEDFTGYQLTASGTHDTYFTNREGQAGIFTKLLMEKAYGLFIKDNPDEEPPLLQETGTTTQKGVVAKNPIFTDSGGRDMVYTPDPNNPGANVETAIKDNVESKKSWLENYGKYLLAEFTEGAAFAVFNVESSGSVGESFSNSFGSNPIESTFNSLSAKSRNLGNLMSSLADIPIVGDAFKLAADTGSIVLSNASFGLANPLLALAYGVNVTMPKMWESSSAQLPRASYKIKLVSPYGNPYSQLFNIYLPLAMILAGSLPRSTGNSSYTSPFNCQLFDRGRVTTRHAMIENVNITRGTSNLAFTRGGHPNAIDVDITIANLDEVISVDVESSGVITKALKVFDDAADSPLKDYITTITGGDVYTQVFRIPMLRLKLADAQMRLGALTDSSAWAAFTVDKINLGGLGTALLGNNQATLQDLIGR